MPCDECASDVLALASSSRRPHPVAWWGGFACVWHRGHMQREPLMQCHGRSIVCKFTLQGSRDPRAWSARARVAYACGNPPVEAALGIAQLSAAIPPPRAAVDCAPASTGNARKFCK